jgi:hypothetical protein
MMTVKSFWQVLEMQKLRMVAVQKHVCLVIVNIEDVTTLAVRSVTSRNGFLLEYLGWGKVKRTEHLIHIV